MSVDDSISSADPQALYRYADCASRASSQLSDGAMRLSAALSYFAATCTGVSHGIDPGSADKLRRFLAFANPQDAWVREVGRDFEIAGSSAAWDGGLAETGVTSSAAPTAGWTFGQLSRILGDKLNEAVVDPLTGLQDGRGMRFLKADFETSRAILEARDIVGKVRDYRELDLVTRGGQVIVHGSNAAREGLGLPLGLRHASDLVVAKDLVKGVYKEEFAELGSGTIAATFFDAGFNAYDNWEKYQDEDFDHRVSKTAVATVADTALEASFSAGGAVALGALGAFLGPPGAFVGGMAGRLAGAYLGKEVVKALHTQEWYESGIGFAAEGVVDAGTALRAQADQVSSTVMDAITKDGTDLGAYASDLVSGAEDLVAHHPDKLLEAVINPVAILF